MTVRVIVVGTDGSDNALRAVSWVADLAEQTTARVLVVHGFEPLAQLDAAPPPVDFEKLLADTRHRLESDWTAPLSRLEVEHETLLGEGDPAQVLVDAADEHDADLIALGTRGLSPLKSLLVGSTSVKVTELSSRPVVLVPSPEGR